MQEFLEAIFQGGLSPDRQLAVFTLPGQSTRRFAELSPAVEYATSQAQAKDVYFGLGLIRGNPPGRGKFEDVAGIGCLWADIDCLSTVHSKSSLPAGLEDALWILDQMPLPPAIVVDSGHGVHAYWLLHEPWIFDSDEARSSGARLAKGWHGLVCKTAAKRDWCLENLGDLARVLRLPGTINHRDPQQAAAVQVIEFHPDRRYAIDDFEPFLPPEADDRQPAEVTGLVLELSAQPPLDKLIAAAAESTLFKQAWDRQRPDLADQSQSAYDLSLATIAALRGWSDQEIANLIIAARRHHGEKPEKALRADYIKRTLARAKQSAEQPTDDVDISALVPAAEVETAPEPKREDPGPIPDELLRVPGFVSEVMDHCLEIAPYPNPILAFCGALALQAFLAGRKVRDQADNRTNLYLLGLAHSSVGKDSPRKINARVLHHIGMAHCLGDGFASGEGIQDLMYTIQNMLFQTDEIDGLLQTINKAKDARHEYIMNTLLRMYSASNGVFSMRPKAGKDHRGSIDQPCLTIFGTAVPTHYYQALSERMLTNGFFARMIVTESGPRSPGQEPRICELPPRILEIAKWWNDFRPGEGNLNNWHPVPPVVEYTEEAKGLFVDARRACETEYAQAESRDDAVGTTVWGRVNENSRKLALVYAVSENYKSPLIGAPAANWGIRFATHQACRMLFQVQTHVADNPFEAECLKFMQKLRAAPDQALPHSVALKRMKMDSRRFQEMVMTLEQRGDVETVIETRAGWPRRLYRLLGEERNMTARVKHEDCSRLRI